MCVTYAIFLLSNYNSKNNENYRLDLNKKSWTYLKQDFPAIRRDGDTWEWQFDCDPATSLKDFTKHLNAEITYRSSSMLIGNTFYIHFEWPFFEELWQWLAHNVLLLSFRMKIFWSLAATECFIFYTISKPCPWKFGIICKIITFFFSVKITLYWNFRNKEKGQF